MLSFGFPLVSTCVTIIRKASLIPSTWRPAELTSTQQVVMQMWNRLLSVVSDVGDQTIASLSNAKCLCGLLSNEVDPAYQGFVFHRDMVRRLDVLRRNHQDMDRSLWTNVAECNNVVGSDHDFGRNFVAANLAKDAVVH